MADGGARNFSAPIRRKKEIIDNRSLSPRLLVEIARPIVWAVAMVGGPASTGAGGE